MVSSLRWFGLIEYATTTSDDVMRGKDESKQLIQREANGGKRDEKPCKVSSDRETIMIGWIDFHSWELI